MTKSNKRTQRKSKSRHQTGGTHDNDNGRLQTTNGNIIVYIILGVLLACVIGIVIYLIMQTEKNNSVILPIVDNPIINKMIKPTINTPANANKENLSDLSVAHPKMSGYRDVGSDADNPNMLSYWDYINIKDHERIINPLLPPERSYENTYGIPINIPSRGFSGGFQQVGTLYKNQIADDGKVIGNSSETVIIPIFGRPLYPGANKWNYYVTSDKYAMVKMPFTFKGKKTDDQYGVDELFDGDVITLPEYNGEFVVKIYQYDKPRYIPFIY